MTVYQKSGNFYLDVARGVVAAANTVNVLGHLPNQNISTQDIWNAGGDFIPLSTAQLVNIASSSSLDAPGQTGGLTVQISGLNSSYVVTTENVTLNGTNNVASVNQYIFINSLKLLTAGQLKVNQGIITARGQTDGNIVAQIDALKGMSQSGFYMTPVGNTTMITQFIANLKALSTSALAKIVMTITPFSGSANTVFEWNLGASPQSFVLDFASPINVSEKSIIKLTSTASLNSTDIIAGFTVVNLFNNLGV